MMGIRFFHNHKCVLCRFVHVRTGIGADMWSCRTLIWMLLVSGFICCVGVLLVCKCWFQNPFLPEVNLLFRWALLAAEKINENGRLRYMYTRAYVGWDYRTGRWQHFVGDTFKKGSRVWLWVFRNVNESSMMYYVKAYI